MKKFRLISALILVLVLPIKILNATIPAVSGVADPVAKNIRTRLAEIEVHTPLRDKSDLNLREEIRQAMQAFGFFKAHVSLQRAANGDMQRIRIQAGPPIRIRHIQIELTGEGKNEPELLEARSAIHLRPGQIFNSQAYEEAKQSLFNAAEHQGYLRNNYTTAVVHINRQQYFVDIRLVFDTGRQFYFGQVCFDPTYLSPKFLHRFTPFEPGQLYETQKILEFNNVLAGSGYFRSVTVKPDINDARYIPIHVHLEPTSRISYILGGGFGTDTGIRGRAGVNVNPVNEMGHKFSLALQGSSVQSALQGQYIIPGHNPVTDQYDITGTLGTQDFDAGRSRSALLSAASRHTTRHYQRAVSLNMLQERYKYTAQPKQDISTLFPRLNLTFKHTEDALFTPTGFSLNFDALAASDKVLSEITFVQGMADARAALTIPLIRTRFYAHTIHGYNTINDINRFPLSLAFLLGGADNLKAFNINAVGPGKIVNYVGFEIQKETWDKWYLVALADAGDVYNPSRRDFKYDAGAAVMWVSPVGPIKIGFAIPVNSRGKRIRGQKPQLVINMGPDI